jgi:hypothetical protein
MGRWSLLNLQRMTRFIRLSFVLLGFGMFIFVASSRFRQSAVPAVEQSTQTNDATVSHENYILRAVLKGPDSNLSVGLATQQAIGEDFVVLIDAQLNPLPAGWVYYGWLIKHVPEFKALPLGRLNRVSEKSNLWKVAFRAASPLVEYGEVWVTREPEYEDGKKPGIIILKGTWNKN